MKHLFFFLVLFCISTAEGQTLFTKRIYKDTNLIQEAKRIIRTPDNKFLVVGYISSSLTSLDRDALVFKIDAAGVVSWAKRYGGINWEEFSDVVQIGSFYYCVGYTRSFCHGKYLVAGVNVTADVFLVKLKLDGTLVWAKNMGKQGNGTSITDGNDIGQRIVGSGQGGVVISIRPNSGAATGQNGGLISIDAVGKTKWAYQYDITSNPSVNELTAGLWKEGTDNYITGGWLGPTSTGFNGGLLYKVNQLGALVWNKNTRCGPGIFESQYYGFYNHNTKKIYTTDFYNQTVSTTREVQVCTNLASNGNVPGGVVPRAKRFHFGLPNSAGNNLRATIYPVGDVYQQFILASYDLSALALNTTKYVNLISVDKDLNFQWTKNVGATHPSSTIGYINQVNDIVTCDGTNQSLLAVGTVNKLTGGNSYKEILITRVTSSGTLNGCDRTNSMNNDTLGETATTLAGLQRVDLNASCGASCWSDNALISNDSITVTSVTFTGYTSCTAPGFTGSDPNASLVASDNNVSVITGSEPNASPAGHNGTDQAEMPFTAPNNILPTIFNGLIDLGFVFLKTPKEVYFELTDVTGTFVYERFFGNMNRLQDGFKFASMNLLKGQYIWEIEAVYADETGIERKSGSFKMQ